MKQFKTSLLAPSIIFALSANLLAQDTYTIETKTLKEALEIISEKSKLSYIANEGLLKDKKAVNIKNVEGLENALKKLLQNTGLKAVIKNNTILIKEKKQLKKNSLSKNDLGSFDIIASSSRTDESDSYTLRETSTATKLDMSLKETPQSISVITRKRIDEQNLNGIVQVLEQTAGINVQRQGNSRFKIYSRGGYTISNFQLDGIPTHSDTGTQTVPQALSDTAIYDHIEVLRGATGLMTGAGEPSGTVNMLRKKPTKKFKSDVNISLGSWDLYRIQGDISGSINKKVRARLISAYQKNKSFQDYLEEERKVIYGIVEADLSDSTLLNLGIDYQEYNPTGHSSVGSLLFYNDLSRTDFTRSHSQAIKWGYDNKHTYNIFATLNQNLVNDWRLRSTVNYLNTDRKFNFGEAAGSLFDKNTGNQTLIWPAIGNTEQSQLGLHLTFDGTYTLFDREHELVVGYNYYKYKNSHIPKLDITRLNKKFVNYYNWGNDVPRMIARGELYNWNTDVIQSGTYIASRLHPSDNLSVILGARFSKYERKDKISSTVSSNFNKKENIDDNVTTPYAGIVYNLNDNHTFYASYTSIFKLQNFKDKNGKYVEPLESVNYEIGYKNELFDGVLNSSIAFYKIKQNNLAVPDPKNIIIGTKEPAYKGIDGAETKGIDMEIAGEITSNLNTQLSYTYARTKNENNKRINTVFPKHMVKFWTTYKMNDLILGGGINWQSKIFFDTSSWLASNKRVYAEQKSYFVTNLMAQYNINKNLFTKININNLLDKKYYDSLDEQFLAGSYGKPRNFMISLNYKF